MSSTDRAIIRALLTALLVSVAFGFAYGLPQSPIGGYSSWWNRGAQLSQSAADQSFSKGFWTDDVLSRALEALLRHIAHVGIDIWNPLGEHALVRYFVALVAIGVVLDWINRLRRFVFEPKAENR
jgi:hypothetical protein